MYRALDTPLNLREQITAIARQRRETLVADLTAALAQDASLDSAHWNQCSELLISVLSTAIQTGEPDSHSPANHQLARFIPPLTVRQLVRAIHAAEMTLLDELALSETIGATSDIWPMVAHTVRGASVEIAGSFAEHHAATGTLRDPLTTLLTPLVFDYALGKEILRALRHQHGIAVILFDIDSLDRLNQSHGHGAGDRLLERLGILARSYFRTHDWVARLGGDSIGVMLPETNLDQAATLACRFRDMVRQRLVLVDHKTDTVAKVTVSAAAVAADIVNAELAAATIVGEAESAAMRAKMNGGDRVETVSLLPTALTITGAASLLGISPRDIVRLIRRRRLAASRRGRHLYILRDQIEEYRKRA